MDHDDLDSHEEDSDEEEAPPPSPLAMEADGAGDEEEGEQFDITLPTMHSYMGGLNPVPGRAVLEAGWRGAVAALAQPGAVFPGETVPLRLPAAAALAIKQLFAVLFPDATGGLASGLGTMCEVFEAAQEAGRFCVKARAIARVRSDQARGRPLFMYTNISMVEVEVLPEYCLQSPLRPARLASLDRCRHSSNPVVRARAGRLDAAVTSWPRFVFDRGDYRLLLEKAHEYFAPVAKIYPPVEPRALSFWLCTNVWARAEDRLALLQEDDATARIHLALSLVTNRGTMVCGRCGASVARLQHAFAMSSHGLRATYTNVGGYLHDVVTVSRASGRGAGASSAEFSWFPGYCWTILVCCSCDSHLGWRFDAMNPTLRPKRFYGLSRNSIKPRLRTSNFSEDFEA